MVDVLIPQTSNSSDYAPDGLTARAEEINNKHETAMMLRRWPLIAAIWVSSIRGFRMPRLATDIPVQFPPSDPSVEAKIETKYGRLCLQCWFTVSVIRRATLANKLYVMRQKI